jgi:hypothetical protein
LDVVATAFISMSKLDLECAAPRHRALFAIFSPKRSSFTYHLCFFFINSLYCIPRLHEYCVSLTGCRSLPCRTWLSRPTCDMCPFVVYMLTSHRQSSSRYSLVCFPRLHQNILTRRRLRAYPLHYCPVVSYTARGEEEITLTLIALAKPHESSLSLTSSERFSIAAKDRRQ